MYLQHERMLGAYPGGNALHLESMNHAIASQGFKAAAVEERIAGLEARLQASERQVRRLVCSCTRELP